MTANDTSDDAFHNAEQLREDIEAMLKRLAPPDNDPPVVEMERTERELIFTAELPWARASKLAVFVRGDFLVAESGARAPASSSGTFMRVGGSGPRTSRESFQLPGWVDATRASGEISSNQMRVVFPRKQYVMPGGTTIA